MERKVGGFHLIEILFFFSFCYLGVVDKQLELESRYQSLGIDVSYGPLGRIQQRRSINSVTSRPTGRRQVE